jgi:hypothetical protein
MFIKKKKKLLSNEKLIFREKHTHLSGRSSESDLIYSTSCFGFRFAVTFLRQTQNQ